MGTEAAPVMFGIPFAICLVILIVNALGERKRQNDRERVLGLGRGRVSSGYLGALGAFLVFCVVGAYRENTLEMALSYFYVFGFLLLIFLTVIFLPLLALLRHAGLVSLLGVLCVSLVLAIGVGFIPGLSVLPSVVVGGILGFAFSIAARLPLLRSSGS